MITYNQISNMLMLQHQLNCVIHPQWWLQAFRYDLAFEQESSEAIDYIPWKWWAKKAKRIDFPALTTEIVDMLHFLLSMHLVDAFKDAVSIETESEQFHQAVRVMEKELSEGYISYSSKLDVYGTSSAVSKFYEAGFIEDLRKVRALSMLEGLGSLRKPFGHLCARLSYACCTDFSKLYQVYLSKNVLNIFRQRNGYKEGTYLKYWWYEKEARFVEDNFWMERILEDNPVASHMYFLEKLESIYKGVSLQAEVAPRELDIATPATHDSTGIKT